MRPPSVNKWIPSHNSKLIFLPHCKIFLDLSPFLLFFSFLSNKSDYNSPNNFKKSTWTTIYIPTLFFPYKKYFNNFLIIRLSLLLTLLSHQSSFWRENQEKGSTFEVNFPSIKNVWSLSVILLLLRVDAVAVGSFFPFFLFSFLFPIN